MKDETIDRGSSSVLEEFEHTSEKLEFRAVLEIVAGTARSERSRGRLMSTALLGSVAEAEEAQREIEELVSLDTLGERPPFSGWEDSAGLVERAREGHVFTGEELVRIARAESKAAELRGFVSRHAERAPLLARRLPRISGRRELVDAVGRAIGRDYEVLDSASPELGRLRRESGVLRNRLRKRFSDYAARVGGGKGYEFVTVRGERYVVSVPRGEAQRVPGIVHQTSASGASLYVEPLEFVEENNRLESLVQEERDEVARILAALSDRVFERRDALLENQNVLVEIDCLAAKAEFARRFRCTRPEHNDEGLLALRAARHPLLERRFAAEGAGRAVHPLDLRCGSDLKALVISGPNAGGKTVALKTVGLLVAMDRAGLLVPCAAESTLPDCASIFVDIGDDQSIEKSLSTFSSRIVRLKRILELADRRSLVLIDEIGDGTDPDEGAALAEAALERLMTVSGRAIVTTHLRTLKGWAHDTPGASNATLEFDTDRLEPLFVLRMGIPGRSWGLEMAGRMGLPREIIDRALQRMGGEAVRLEELLAHLEKTERAVTAERAELVKKEQMLAGLVESYRDRLERFKEDRDELITKARAEALEIVSSTRKEMEKLIQEIKLTQAERSVIRQAHERIEERKRAFAPKPPRRKEPEAPPLARESIRPGVWAKIRSLGKEGRITTVDSGSRVFLELDGGLRVETGIDDLAAAERPGKRRAEKKATWTLPGSTAPASDELMVRGLEKAEALEKVDAFLDQAVLHGLKTVVVIHGIGKGILKRAIYDMLRRDPRVADVHPGDPSRGGAGVAVVELK
jgi:DNA mismatch repair protein MutS2